MVAAYPSAFSDIFITILQFYSDAMIIFLLYEQITVSVQGILIFYNSNYHWSYGHVALFVFPEWANLFITTELIFKKLLGL